MKELSLSTVCSALKGMLDLQHFSDSQKQKILGVVEMLNEKSESERGFDEMATLMVKNQRSLAKVRRKRMNDSFYGLLKEHGGCPENVPFEKLIQFSQYSLDISESDPVRAEALRRLSAKPKSLKRDIKRNATEAIQSVMDIHVNHRDYVHKIKMRDTASRKTKDENVNLSTLARMGLCRV